MLDAMSPELFPERERARPLYAPRVVPDDIDLAFFCDDGAPVICDDVELGANTVSECAYAAGDPINLRDPWGLTPNQEAANGGPAVGAEDGFDPAFVSEGGETVVRAPHGCTWGDGRTCAEKALDDARARAEQGNEAGIVAAAGVAARKVAPEVAREGGKIVGRIGTSEAAAAAADRAPPNPYLKGFLAVMVIGLAVWEVTHTPPMALPRFRTPPGASLAPPNTPPHIKIEFDNYRLGGGDLGFQDWLTERALVAQHAAEAQGPATPQWFTSPEAAAGILEGTLERVGEAVITNEELIREGWETRGYYRTFSGTKLSIDQKRIGGVLVYGSSHVSSGQDID